MYYQRVSNTMVDLCLLKPLVSSSTKHKDNIHYELVSSARYVKVADTDNITLGDLIKYTIIMMHMARLL